MAPEVRAMSRSRRRVLEALEQAAAPADVNEIAARAGLQVNATRHHLAGLVAEGRAVAAVDRAGHRGRPRVLWHAPPVPAGPYERLALALLRARRTGETLEQAGRAVAPGGGDVVAFLAAEGFDPRPDGDRVLLARCPLDAAVAADADTVCRVHRGLVAAFGDRSGQATVLDVSAPGHCHLRDPAATPVAAEITRQPRRRP
jgi:predicted ArsR family transcriptional regulator